MTNDRCQLLDTIKKPKTLLYFFSFVGFVCGVDIILESLLHKEPSQLYDIYSILFMVGFGIIALAITRRATCIFFNGNNYVKISFLIFFSIFVASSHDYYAPFATALLFASALFVVSHGIINKTPSRSDRDCESFFKNDLITRGKIK